MNSLRNFLPPHKTVQNKVVPTTSHSPCVNSCHAAEFVEAMVSNMTTTGWTLATGDDNLLRQLLGDTLLYHSYIAASPQFFVQPGMAAHISTLQLATCQCRAPARQRLHESRIRNRNRFLSHCTGGVMALTWISLGSGGCIALRFAS